MMSYYKVTEVLPKHIIREIQKYVDGHSIYIPKKPDNKKNWGENTETWADIFWIFGGIFYCSTFRKILSGRKKYTTYYSTKKTKIILCAID